MPRFAYTYLMTDDPDRVQEVAPQHVAYWQRLELDAYLGGPFADRSGGLITFAVASRELAEQAVSGDPFQRERLVERSWLKEWQPTGRHPG